MPGGFETTDVAAHVGAPAQSPLETIGQLANVRNALNQNKMFPLQFQAQQLANQTTQQGLQTARIAALQGALASTKDASEVPDVVSRYVQAGLIDPDTAAGILGGNVSGFDAASLAVRRRQAIMQAGNAAEVTAMTGTPTAVGTGAGTQFVNVNPFTNTESKMEGPSGGFVPNEQGPSEQGQLISYQSSNGQTKQIARSAIQDAHGHGIPNVKDGDGNQLTDAAGALTTTLSPNDAALLNTTAQNQADRATSLETAFEGSAQRKALIQELLQTNGEFRSGPGAAKWSSIVTEFNRIFGTNFAADPAEAQQVFGKIAQMISSQQRDTLGLPATNAGQAAADVASPNTEYSTKAIQAVAGQLAGNEDLLQRKEAAWAKYHKAGGTYNGFIRQFNRAYDPRFFWDQYVPDEQKAEAGMTAPQKAEYERQRERALGLKF